MSHPSRKLPSRRAASTRSAFRALLTLSVSASALMGGSTVATATDHLWNVTSGNFNVGTNWTPTTVPGSGDNAFVNNGGTCLITDSESTYDCDAGNTAGVTGNTYTMSAGTLTVNSWFRFGEATGATGTFNLNGGTVLLSQSQAGTNFNLGEVSGSTGNVVIGGGTFNFGLAGGTNSYLLEVGENGVGNLNITAGALNLAGSGTTTGLTIGTFATGVGTVTVSGGTLSNTNVSNAFMVGAAGKGTLNLSAGAINNARSMTLGVSSSGNGTVNVSGGTFTESVSLSVGVLGTGAVTQTAGTINISSTLNIGAGATGVGSYGISGGTTTTTGALLLGTVSGGVGSLSISGGTFTENSYTSIGTTSGGTGTISVSAGKFATGDMNTSDTTGSKGTLNVSGTAVMTTGQLFVGKSGTATGILNQSGGTLTTSGADTRVGGNGATTDSSAVGFFNLSGGTFNGSGNTQIGAYGVGYLNQTAGTFNSASFTDAGRFIGSLGVIDVSGGAFNSNNTTTKLFAGESGFGIITVRGTGTITAAGGLTIGNGGTGAGGIFNLDGGTLNTPVIASSATASTAGNTFNFNGGTLKPTAANANFFTSVGAGTAIVANVFAGNAIIDTSNGSVTVAQSLVAPAGNGVSAITVGNAGAGYVTAPVVKISAPSAGGTQATAVATISGGVITGYIITNPGTGYTTAPTVTLVSGLYAPTTVATATTTIAANTSGGLVKNGVNTLTLSGANTFTGGLTVNAGILQAGSAGSFPSGSALTNNGATVDFVNQFAKGPGSTTPGLTLSSLTTTANSKFLFTLSTTGASYVNITGAATIGTGNTITVSSPAGQTLASGNYNLFTAGSGDLSTISLTNNFVITGGNYYPLTYSATTGADVLTVGTGQVARIFYSGANGTSLNSSNDFTTDSAGMTTNTANTASFTDVVFSASNASNTTPTVDSDLTLNSLEFATTSAVTVGGSATLTLAAGQNTFAAGVGIVVDSGAGADTIAANLNLATSQSFSNNSSSLFTVSGGISSTNFATTLTLGGTGTGGFLLSGNNTYVGGTTVTAGTVTLGSSTALGASGNNVTVNGGVLAVNGQTVTQNSLTLGGGTVSALTPATGLLTLGSTGVAVNISGTYANPVTTPTVGANLAFPNGGYIAKTSGAGTPVFTGAITLGGTTTVALADTGGDAAGELSLTGVIGGAGTLTLNDFVNPPGVTLANNLDYGTLTLTGINTYNGGTNITSGRIVVTNGSALGTGLVTVTQGTGNSGTTGSAGGVLSLGNSLYTGTGTTPSSPLAPGAIPAAGITIANNINLGGQIAGNYGYGLYNDSGANILSGNITLTNASQVININGGSLNVSGPVTQSAGVAAGITKTGANALTLSGTDVFTGASTVSAGTLAVSGSVTGPAITVAANGTAGGVAPTLNLTGTLTNSAVTVANGTVPGAFTESATGLLAGTSSLTTSGTTTLGNNANSYTGATTLLVSSVSVADLENGGVNSTIGASTNAPGSLVIGGNGTLLYTGPATTIDRGFTVGSTLATGGAIINDANDLTFGGQIVAANNASFTKLGTGTLTFTNATGTNTFTAGNSGNTLGFNVNQGTVNISGTPTAPVAATNVFFGEVDSGTINSATSPTTTLNFNGGTNTIGTYLTAGRGNGTNNAATFVNLNNNAAVSVGNLAVGYSNGVTNYSSSPTISFNNTSTFTDAGVFRTGESANVAGVTTINVNDTAALTLNGGEFSVGYQGPAVFNQNGGMVTQNGTTPVILANNTAASTGTYNLNGGVLNAPRVIKGAGTGTFNFNGGTLTATASDVPATAPFMTGVTANVGNNGAIINTNFTDTVASALVPASGSTGGLTANGTGRLNLIAANTYTGATTINNGTLNIDSGSTGPSTSGSINATSAVNVNAGGTLLLSGSNTVNTRVNDAAPVTLTGGTIALAGVAEGGGGAGGVSSTGAVGVGALTLNASSVIDLQGTSLLHLAASGSQTWTGTLSIYNWTGGTSLAPGGAAEQLLFGTDDTAASLTATQLGQIVFYSDNGMSILGTGQFAGLNDGEVVPNVPEPATWLAGALTLGLLGYSQRRRVAGWLNLARAV